MLRRTTLCVLGILPFAGPVSAEIVRFTGFAEIHVRQFQNGSQTDSVLARDTFPDTDPNLPLQVVGILRPVAGQAPSAGAAAAQFAQPGGGFSSNPEEFAINLALSTKSNAIRYSGDALARERRTIRLGPADAPGSQPGDTERFFGTLFLDGALAVFASDPNADLTGAEVTFQVTVRKITGEQSETVFSGSVALRGGAGGRVDMTTAGDFPSGRMILADLAAVLPDFDVATVLIMPGIAVQYPFDVVIGQECDLEAEVRVDAQNVEGRTGVAAILGAPVDTLAQVLDLVHGEPASTKFISALQQERARAGAGPALNTSGTPALSALLCPTLGFVPLLGCGVAGVRRRCRAEQRAGSCRV